MANKNYMKRAKDKAKRKRRDLVAKELLTNPVFKPKVIPVKRKPVSISKEIDEYYKDRANQYNPKMEY